MLSKITKSTFQAAVRKTLDEKAKESLRNHKNKIAHSLFIKESEDVDIKAELDEANRLNKAKKNAVVASHGKNGFSSHKTLGNAAKKASTTSKARASDVRKGRAKIKAR